MKLDEMLQELIGIAVEVTGCDACLVYLPNPENNEIVLRASQLPHAAEIGNLRLKMGEGVTGWVAEHRSIVALANRAACDQRFKTVPTLVEDTFEAFLSVPLISGGDIIGVLNAHHRKPHVHTPEEIALMSFVGEHMGAAIAMSRLAEENARLLEEAQEMKQQLETRKVLERAKGILQTRYNLTEQQAYDRLRNESRRLRKPIRDLADAVLLVEQIGQGETTSSS